MCTPVASAVAGWVPLVVVVCTSYLLLASTADLVVVRVAHEALGLVNRGSSGNIRHRMAMSVSFEDAASAAARTTLTTRCAADHEQGCRLRFQCLPS